MKELNRREFLTLSGAAVVALSLAGCGGPSAPAVPTNGKAAKVLEAINKVWEELYHEKLEYSQDAAAYAALAAKPLVNSGNNPLYMSLNEIEAWKDGLETFRDTLMPKYGDEVEVTLEGVRHGSSINDPRETLSLTEEYTTDDAAIRKLVKGIMTRPRMIGVYCPVFGNKTYMVVALLHSVK